MKLNVEVDTADADDARVIAEGFFRLAQCVAEGTAVTLVVNGRTIRVDVAAEWRDRLSRRYEWKPTHVVDVERSASLNPADRLDKPEGIPRVSGSGKAGPRLHEKPV